MVTYEFLMIYNTAMMSLIWGTNCFILVTLLLIERNTRKR